MAMPSRRLLEEPNPLLDGLGTYIPLDCWPEKLAFDPLEDIDILSMTEEERDIGIALIYQRYAPTRPIIKLARAVQTMVRTRYAVGNPIVAANRARIAALSAHHGKTAAQVPVGPPIVFGMLFMGITGPGKSVGLGRILSQWPAVVRHGRCDAAGWDKQIQIPYLVVQLTSHRGGLIHAILAAIDNLIGTNYREQYSLNRSWNVDKLFVEVPLLLMKYWVGVLVIEEVQVRNFAMAPHRDDLLLMFLRLLNYGIPVILVGNPLGFTAFDEFAQDLRRLTREDPIAVSYTHLTLPTNREV